MAGRVAGRRRGGQRGSCGEGGGEVPACMREFETDQTTVLTPRIIVFSSCLHSRTWGRGLGVFGIQYSSIVAQ